MGTSLQHFTPVDYISSYLHEVVHRCRITPAGAALIPQNLTSYTLIPFIYGPAGLQPDGVHTSSNIFSLDLLKVHCHDDVILRSDVKLQS